MGQASERDGESLANKMVFHTIWCPRKISNAYTNYFRAALASLFTQELSAVRDVLHKGLKLLAYDFNRPRPIGTC
jgi:hypothetical protein